MKKPSFMNPPRSSPLICVSKVCCSLSGVKCLAWRMCHVGAAWYTQTVCLPIHFTLLRVMCFPAAASKPPVCFTHPLDRRLLSPMDSSSTRPWTAMCFLCQTFTCICCSLLAQTLRWILWRLRGNVQSVVGSRVSLAHFHRTITVQSSAS